MERERLDRDVFRRHELDQPDLGRPDLERHVVDRPYLERSHLERPHLEQRRLVRRHLGGSDLERPHLVRQRLGRWLVELTRTPALPFRSPPASTSKAIMAAPRRTTGALLALALLSGLAATTTPAAAEGPADGYIVRAAPGTLAAATARVADLGGTVTRTLGIIDAVAVDATPAVAARLRADALLGEVTADGRVELATTTYDPVADTGSMLNVTTVTGTRQQWKGGLTGKGVDVALIDSGVTPVEGLATTGKVVHGPDLSFESQSSATRNLDTFGHGTHMAGIIAGKDSTADPASPTSTQFVGMAPDARIVSVKVADAYGATDVSQVIAGIDWVVQHKNDPGFNIRVLNLSFGTPSTQSYVLDPLAHAAEQAWHKGLVVVVSAGNDGTGTGKLLNPAQDPYVLAVGAEKSQGTKSIFDDTIADFSTRGDGTRNPDVVAPGASIQSLRVPGSWIDTQNPTAVLGERFFRGSGTSQAAAVVSGMAALLVQQRPGLSPDQVKSLLRGNAVSLPAADVQAQGKGLAKTDRAVNASPQNATQTWTRSTGTGSLDAARGDAKLVLDSVPLSGEQDIFGNAFDSTTHAALAEAGATWTDGDWLGRTWAGRTWAAGSWESAVWAGNTWTGRTWAGRTWASGSWLGRTWAGQSWTDPTTNAAGTLTGRTWAGRTWAGGGWK